MALMKHLWFFFSSLYCHDLLWAPSDFNQVNGTIIQREISPLMTPSFQPYDQGRCLKALSVDNIKGFQDDLGHIVTRFLNINISSVTISFVVLKLMSLD